MLEVLHTYEIISASDPFDTTQDETHEASPQGSAPAADLQSSFPASASLDGLWPKVHDYVCV